MHLALYDMLGRERKTLVDEWKDAGSYAVELDVRDLPASVYMYRLTMDDATHSAKVVVAR